MRMNPCLIGLFFALEIIGSRGFDSVAALQDYLQMHHYALVRTENDGDASRQKFVARINGRKVELVIDTGASSTVLTDSCARRIRLGVIDTGKPLLGAGGQIEGSGGRAWMDSFSIGDYQLSQRGTINILPPNAELDADGLFGLDALVSNCSILPVGASGFFIRTAAVEPPSIEDYMRHLGFSKIPLELWRDGLILTGTYDGKPFRGLIDTGAPYTTFETGYLKSIRARNRKPEEGVFMDGVDGRQNASSFVTPKSLTLGNFQVAPLTISTFESPTMRAINVDALIGYDVLAVHGAVIEAARGILWIR